MWEFIQIFALASIIIDGIASIFVPGIQDLLWHHPWIFIRLTRNSALVALGIFWIRRAVSLLNVEERGINFKTSVRVGLPATLLIFFFLAYMKQFSQDVYSKIPFALGGGKPQSVVFLLKQGAESPPVVRDKAGNKSIPYSLILETDNAYAVVSQDSNEQAIQFNREAVEGYIVLRQK